MDWKDSFSPDVLAHGWDLFRNHQIGQIYKQDNLYEARFPDHNRTQAIVNNGFVESVSCTCPRSQYGQLCEHEAAMLFALEHPASKPETPKPAPFGQGAAKPVSKPAIQEECETLQPENADFFSRPIPDQAPKPDEASSSLLDELERLFGLDSPDLESKPQPEQMTETVQKPSFHQQMASSNKAPSTIPGNRNQPGQPKLNARPPFTEPATPKQPPKEFNPAFHPAFSGQPSRPAEKPKQPAFQKPLPSAVVNHPHGNPSVHEHPVKPEPPRRQPDTPSQPHRVFPESKTPFEDLWHALQAQSEPTPQAAKEQADETLPVDKPNWIHEENKQPVIQPKPEKTSKLKPQAQPGSEKEKPHPAPSFESPSLQPQAKQPAESKPEPKQPETPKPQPKPVEPPKPERQTPVNHFVALLESLKPDALNQLLDTYAKAHPEFKDFMLAGSLESNPDAIGLILEEARTRLKACLVQDGSFHPRQASQKAAAFTAWLNDQVMALVQARQEASAADLLQSVLVDLNESVYDDDDLEVDWIVDQIFTMYSHLLSGSPALVIKETFSWLENHLSGTKPMVFDLEMIKFVQKPDFNREEIASLKLSLLLQILENKDRFVLGPIYRRQLIRSILGLIDTFPELEAQAVSFSQMYGSQPYVLLEQAKQALNENKLQKAQLLLKKARSQKLTSIQEEETCRMLIAIYTAQNQPDLALRELKELIFVLQAAEPDDIFKLQELESEQEWAEDFKKFEAIAPIELLILAYDRLSLDDKLLSALEQKPNIHDLILYEDRLTQVDPDRTARLWLVNAKSIAKQANERHDYHRIAAALKKAAAHPATHDEALQFAAELKEMNHRRKALLEELEHAGF